MVTLKPGIIFDKRYLILNELGHGGMGQVFHARQVDADREVALKLLKVTASDEENQKRFFQEFKVLSELAHPHIMTVYGLALDHESNPYAICEFLEGESLRSRLTQGPFSWKEAVEIALQICEALSYAHKNGVIHRDLKPENIMLIDRPSPNYVKLIDFGLSKVLQANAQKLTGTGQLLGSPLYMSPELARQAADERSDVYSLACIIFEMLSGEYLFPAEEAIAAMYMHSNESPTARFTTIAQQVPESLIDLLTDMLTKKPEDRCQTVAEVSSRLQTVKDSQGSVYTPSSKRAKWPKLISAAILVLVILIVLATNHSNKLWTNNLSPKKSESFELKTVGRQLIGIENERLKIRNFQITHGITELPKEEKESILRLIKQLQSLIPKAKGIAESFLILWLEGESYGAIKDYQNRLKCLEKSLELCRFQSSQTKKRYADEIEILRLQALNLGYQGNWEEAKKTALEALRLRRDYGDSVKRGVKIYSLLPGRSILTSVVPWNAPQLDGQLLDIYFNLGDFQEAVRYAPVIYDRELKQFPQTKPANASIGYTLTYADCLLKLGKKEHAIGKVEQIIKLFNKVGDIPESQQRPTEQKATASDIVHCYISACNWFEKNGEPQLAKKYRKQAREYARYYGLEERWKRGLTDP